MGATHRWSPFDPKWYQQAFDEYIGSAEELFQQNAIIAQGYHLPDSDGSKSSVFRDDAVLNNTFNEQALRETLKDLYLNSSAKQIASNHDGTHFFRWYGTMSDFQIIPNTNECEMIIPTEGFIAPDTRDRYKLSQYYRKWITVEDILNHCDTFHWCCLLFINHKIYSDYQLRIDDHQTTIRFRFVNYWYKQNFPVYLYKFDTNASERIQITRELCENQWNWKVPLSQLQNTNILHADTVMVTFNKKGEGRTDGLDQVEVLGDNIEFLPIHDGYIDLTNISTFNRQYIRSELKEWLWMSIIVPKFFHEYPVLLPTDVIYRPYEMNLQKVSIVEGDYLQHVKTDPEEDSFEQVYVDLNEGPTEDNHGWTQMIRPVVLSDAFRGVYNDPYIVFLGELRELRDATVAGADLIESMRFDLQDLDESLDQILMQLTKIHEIHNGFLDQLLIDHDQTYEAVYDRFLEVQEEIRKEGPESPWLHADQKSDKNFWNLISPLIYIPRALVDRYNILETTSMLQDQNYLYEDPKRFANQLRYQRPVAEEDFWLFEFDINAKVWRPCALDVTHHFPDVYLLKDPNNDTPGRVFKAFFFYSDSSNTRNIAQDFEEPTPAWDEDVETFHINPMGTCRDIFLEKFYWMGVRAIYRGYLLTDSRWEALEYVIDNHSYDRYNDLFLKTIDPYIKLGMATYLHSTRYGFPFDDAIAKIRESLDTKWLGYRKVSNFEMYLQKQWKPSYFDTVVSITNDFAPNTEQMIQRPHATFDAERLLNRLHTVQQDIQHTTSSVLERLEWILQQAVEHDYPIAEDRVQSLYESVQNMNSKVLAMLQFLEEMDPSLYGNTDICTLINAIIEYLQKLDALQEEVQQVYEDAVLRSHYGEKHQLLDTVSMTIQGLPTYIDPMLDSAQSFDLSEFMKASNELRTHLYYDKENPDDNSLIGYVNKFDDPWSMEVKNARNAFFVASTKLDGMISTIEPYTREEVKTVQMAIQNTRNALQTFGTSLKEFCRIHARPLDQTILDRFEYSLELLDEAYGILEQYLEARKALMAQVQIIWDAMSKVEGFTVSDTERSYMHTIDGNINEILTALSYIAAHGDRVTAYASHQQMVQTIAEWISYANGEGQVFDQLIDLLQPPVAFLTDLLSQRGILESILTYLKSANSEFEPEERTSYGTIFEVQRAELASGGFGHQTGEEAYVPNLASYRILEVSTDEIQTARSILKLPYRCTTYRDPRIQSRPYDSITTGSGSGLTIHPTDVRQTNVICDSIVGIIQARYQNQIRQLKDDVNTVNPMDNSNLEINLADLEAIHTRWERMQIQYQDHLSDGTCSAMEELVSAFDNTIPTFRTFIEHRAGLSLDTLLADADEALDTVEDEVMLPEDIRDNIVLAFRMFAMFYGNGTYWSDLEELSDRIQTCATAWDLLIQHLEENTSEACTEMHRRLHSILDHIPSIRETQKSLQMDVDALEHRLQNFPEGQNDTWYQLIKYPVAVGGNGYRVGDIVQLLGDERMTNDHLLFQVLRVEDGVAQEVTPIIDYAIPYEVSGVFETQRMIGSGTRLKIEVLSRKINQSDLLDYTSEDSDELLPTQYGENDLIAFRFQNIHDLDVHYDVFVGGTQIQNYVHRHEDGMDRIYIPANQIMNLKNRCIQTPGENYLEYRVTDVVIQDPGAGYCVGQTIFVGTNAGILQLRVETLDGTPFKGIGSVSVISGNGVVKDIDPSVEHAEVVSDPMNNIDDEYHNNRYDLIPQEGILKAATKGYPIEEYPFVSMRFDTLESGDRNLTFLYPKVRGTANGDPEEGWYLGSRIDNSQVPMADDQIGEGIENVIPHADSFLPDALRTPPGLPVKGEYQKITDVHFHRNATPYTDYDLEVATFAELPRSTEDYPEGRRGKRILVRQDETQGFHTTVYEIRTFMSTGYFVYDLPVYADDCWNTLQVDWLQCDWHPDEPTQKASYPTAPYETAKTYREIEQEISDGKHEPTYSGLDINTVSYIPDLTVDDLSVFNWDTKSWEELHDSSRWKLTVRSEDRDWGFSLEYLATDVYDVHFSVYLNKTPDTLSRIATLKRNATVDVVAHVVREVEIPPETTIVNVGREVRIRKLFPYEQKETYYLNSKQYEMTFCIAPYMHFRNELHLEDVLVYNHKAKRYEDILDPTLFEVQFKDPKATRTGSETHRKIESCLIAEVGAGYHNGEAWAYNAEHDLQIFGTITVDPYGDETIQTFIPTHTPFIPEEDIWLEFVVYQDNSQFISEFAKLTVHYTTETVMLYGDGYIHHVSNPLAVLPDTFKVIVQYDPGTDAEYELIIDQSVREWEFSYSNWSNSPVFHIYDAWVPADRLYITTDNGRLPLINPSTGAPYFHVQYLDNGMDIKLDTLYQPYQRIRIHAMSYPMRSVYSQRTVPENGYIDLNGRINKPLNKRYHEFWMNGQLLSDEVTIITPTKLILHGLRSLQNFEIVEINRDPNEYFSNDFLGMQINNQGIPQRYWDFQTYLDAALSGTLEGDNYTLEEQEYLLTPVWKQVSKEHPEYRNYPPNIEADDDLLSSAGADAAVSESSGDIIYQTSVVGVPSIENQLVNTRRLTFQQFGWKPITDEEIVDLIREEWKTEIEDPSIQFPTPVVISEDQWYGMFAKLYDAYGNRVHNINEAAYAIYDQNLLTINRDTKVIRIIPQSVSYDLN